MIWEQLNYGVQKWMVWLYMVYFSDYCKRSVDGLSRTKWIFITSLINEVSSEVDVCIMACNSNACFVQFIVRFCSFLLFQLVQFKLLWDEYNLESNLKMSVLQWNIYSPYIFGLMWYWFPVLLPSYVAIVGHNGQLITPLGQLFVSTVPIFRNNSCILWCLWNYWLLSWESFLRSVLCAWTLL